MMITALRASNLAGKSIAKTLHPILVLGVRLWLAQIFLLAAAVQLATPGQPAPSNLYACFEGWLNAGSASTMAVIWLTVMFSLMLAGGLMARLSALVLAGIALAAFAFNAGQEQNLLWALMFVFIALFGAGPISLDVVFKGGISRNPLLSALALQGLGGLAWLKDSFSTLLRVWLVLVLLMGATNPSSAGVISEVLAPLSMTFGVFGTEIHFILAALAVFFLAPGFMSRPAAGLATAIVVLIGVSTGRAETLYLAALIGFLASAGPGYGALDCMLKLDKWPSAGLGADDKVPHIVVVGAGFGGLAAVNALMRQKCRITLIDRRNHHLFQPLLYQVATAALSPSDIALPIRALFRGQLNVRVLLGEVCGVDRKSSEVLLGDRRIAYDHLIIASGAKPCYYGQDHWAAQAPGLKQIEDATHIRSRLLAAFEHAEDAPNAQQRDAWMTFVIIGAGPTGIEMAGALAELARQGLSNEFRRIDPAKARIIVLDRGSRCLRAFPDACSARAAQMLKNLGVELRHGASLAELDDAGLTLQDGTRIETRTVLWTAGVEASPAAKWLGVAPAPGGRVAVTGQLRLDDDERIFVIGDTAAIAKADGGFVPGLAPAAKQAGTYAARVISASMAGKPQPRPFRYQHQGSLATIGRSSAIADFGWLQLSGASAWWLWGAIHVGFLTGVRNRISVFLQWFWAYITYHRSTRLITLANASHNAHTNAKPRQEDDKKDTPFPLFLPASQASPAKPEKATSSIQT